MYSCYNTLHFILLLSYIAITIIALVLSSYHFVFQVECHLSTRGQDSLIGRYRIIISVHFYGNHTFFT